MSGSRRAAESHSLIYTSSRDAALRDRGRFAQLRLPEPVGGVTLPCSVRRDRTVAWRRAGGIRWVSAVLVLAACTGVADDIEDGDGEAGADVTEAVAGELPDEEPIATHRDQWEADTLEWICDMLTLDEVNAALERPAEAGTAYPGDPTCVWVAGSSSYSVRLNVWERPSAISDDDAPVEGVGAQAGWHAPTRTLAVLDGDIRFNLSVQRFDLIDDDAQALEIAVELATKVLERIPRS